jgi:hypothetical protein
MSRPLRCTDLTAHQKEKFSKFSEKINANEPLKEHEQKFYDILVAKKERFNDPPLSETAKKYLITRYSWEKYNCGTLPVNEKRSQLIKGNELEADAIKMLSKRDRVKYIKGEEFINNEFVFGRCDIFSPERKKVVDIKVSWGIHSYLPNHTTALSRKYWMQMQAYLELYDLEVGEVCWVLLNTPSFLLEREKTKVTEKYMTGEIDAEKFEEQMERLEMNYDYSQIPRKRKIITFVVSRERGFMETVYRKVEKCRVWMTEFDKIHSDNKKIITLSDKYAATSTEDNTEPDTD